MESSQVEKKYSAKRGTFEQFCADFHIDIQIPLDVYEATKQLLINHGLTDDEAEQQITYAQSNMTMNSSNQLLFYVYDKSKKGYIDEEGVKQLFADQEFGSFDESQINTIFQQLSIKDQNKLNLEEFERLYQLLASTSENLQQYL